MTDTRIEQLADILVDYSTKITAGDEVQLLTTAPLGLPLFRACYRRVLERGAHVYTHIGFQDQQEIFFKSASEAQLKHFPDLLLEETKRATAYIRIGANLNSRTLAGVEAEDVRSYPCGFEEGWRDGPGREFLLPEVAVDGLSAGGQYGRRGGRRLAGVPAG